MVEDMFGDIMWTGEKNNNDLFGYPTSAGQVHIKTGKKIKIWVRSTELEEEMLEADTFKEMMDELRGRDLEQYMVADIEILGLDEWNEFLEVLGVLDVCVASGIASMAVKGSKTDPIKELRDIILRGEKK
jgi:hypothetical protein